MGVLDSLKDRLTGKAGVPKFDDVLANAHKTGKVFRGHAIHKGLKIRAAIEPMVELSVAELREACEGATEAHKKIAETLFQSVDGMNDDQLVNCLKQDIAALIGVDPTAVETKEQPTKATPAKGDK